MKSKIVYAEDNVDVREIFVLKIQTVTDLDIIQMSCGNDTIEYLKENQDQIACVISDLNMDNGSGKDIYHFLYEERMEIPFVLLSGEGDWIINEFRDFKKFHSLNNIIDKPPREGQLEKALAFLDDLDTAKRPIMDQEFIPFHLNLLCHGNYAPEDIFLKMRSDRHVHLYHKGAPLTGQDVKKFKERNVEFVYVKIENVDSFLAHYMEIMSQLIEKETSGASGTSGVSGQSISVHYKVHELIHKQLITAGITPQVMALTQKTVDSCIASIQNETNLAPLLKKLINTGDWLYEHSLMLSFLSSLILERLEWTSKDTLQKVTIACLFHDIVLSDGQVAKELELKYDEADKDLIKMANPCYYRHCTEAAQYVSEIKGIPLDAHSIIAQGHERPDGSGFPQGLKGRKTFPLACVVNTAHAFLNEMYRFGFSQKSAIAAVRKMERTYHIGHYDKPFVELKKIFKIF